MEIKIRKIKKQAHYKEVLDFTQESEVTHTNDTSQTTLLISERLMPHSRHWLICTGLHDRESSS